jgi:hypothetical protein
MSVETSSLSCAEAVAGLATHRNIQVVHARLVKYDVDIRPVLEAVIRRWTLLLPTSLQSTGAASTPGAKLHREHVVPCRVLVDRMIMDPSECRGLLEGAVVVASVTPGEHRRLGGIYTHHEDLYRRMHTAPIPELPGLGIERYRATGVEVFPRF